MPAAFHLFMCLWAHVVTSLTLFYGCSDAYRAAFDKHFAFQKVAVIRDSNILMNLQ